MLPLTKMEGPLRKLPLDIYIPDPQLGWGIIPGQPTVGIKIKTCEF